MNHNSYGFFGQDEWKATPKLTLTLGLRYDFESYPKFCSAQGPEQFSAARRSGVCASALVPSCRAGFGIFNDRLFSSIGQLLTTVHWVARATSPMPRSFSPRSPLYGRCSFSQQLAAPCRDIHNLPPRGDRRLQHAVAAQLATCIFTSTGAVPAAPSVGGIVNPGFRHNLSGTMRTPYTEQANLEISHEFNGGVAVTANYLFVHGLKIGTVTGILNGVQTGTLPSGKPIFNRALGGRQFAELGDFYSNDDIGFSIHHGGTLEVEKRFSEASVFTAAIRFQRPSTTPIQWRTLRTCRKDRISRISAPFRVKAYPTGSRWLL